MSGLLIVLSGPSGVGKGTIRESLFQGESNFKFSVSATTRSPRSGEQDGREYYFLSVEKFEEMIENDELVEYAKFVGNYYGTPQAMIEKQRSKGYDVVLEIEVDGAMQVRRKMPDAIFIFIAPPNVESLRSRLQGRNTESKETIEQRIQAAELEMQFAEKYDYVVINDTVESAVEKIKEIIKLHK